MGIAIIVPDCDYSNANLGQVTLQGSVPLKSLGINGESSVTGTSSQYYVSYTPAITTDRSVKWSVVSGSTYAAINADTGNLLILPDADSSEVVIKVESLTDNSIYATKTVTVTYSNTDALVLREGMALVSDGTAYLNAAQYFDGTRRWNTGALNMEIVFKIYEAGSENLHIFGISMSTSTTNKGYLDAVYIGNTPVLRFGGIKDGELYTDANNIANSLYKYSSYMNGNITVQKNGNIVFTQAVASCNTVQTDLFPLFARTSNGGSGFAVYSGAANVGIYSFKLATEDDGNVCDLVPCTYNDVPAMYDKISNQVLTVVDGGSFTLNQ